MIQARLIITADDRYQLFLDNREVGRGHEWRNLSEYDVTDLMSPGEHVLAIDAFNDYDNAGVIFGLRAEFADGKFMEVRSDETCRVVPQTEKENWKRMVTPRSHWPKATVVGALGSPPWWKRIPSIVQVPLLPAVTTHFWQTGWFQICLISLCGVAGLVCLQLMFKITMQSNERKLLQRERARIARDIHDDFGSRLTSLVLVGEMAQCALPVESEARGQFDQMCERARDLLGTIDEIIWMINSRRDTVENFTTYVCNYFEAFLKPTAIRCRFKVDPDIPANTFDLPVRRNLFLAIKEALNNAVRHSDATELCLQIGWKEKRITVVVEDNGKGFNVENTIGRGPQAHGNGLTNMIQRAYEVGGTCHLSSQPGAGCRVVFEAPLVHSTKRQSAWWRWQPACQPLVIEQSANSRPITPLSGESRRSANEPT